MPAIERSAGIPITIGGHPTGQVAGGGYRGFSEELDATVQRAAELLADAYGLPVTIRFNSDRRSGGAWLRTHEQDGVGANAEIGIGARLFSEQMKADAIARLQRELERDRAEIERELAGGDRQRLKLLQEIVALETRRLEELEASETGVFVHAHIGAQALTDKSLATSRADDPERAYYHGHQAMLEQALAFVQAHGSLAHLDLSWIEERA